MKDVGKYPNDLLVVDRAVGARHSDIVVACIRGEMTVKELNIQPKVCLVPHNAAYSTILITENDVFEVFGVVTNVVRKLIRMRT